jgi:hypothetical protein
MRIIIIFMSIIFVFGITMNSCISEKVEEVVPDPDPNPNPDPDPNPNPDPGAKKEFNFKVTLESPYLSVQSMNNRRIGLFLYNDVNAIQSNTPVTLSNIDGKLEVSTNYTRSFCFGYYPYSTTAISSDAAYNGEIPSIQNQDVLSLASMTDMPDSLLNKLLMVSSHSTNVNFVDETAVIQFRNIFSVLRFSILLDESLAYIGDQYLTKAKIYVAEEADMLTPLPYRLAGSYSLNLRSNNLTPVFSRTYDSITVDITNKPLFSRERLVFLWSVIPPIDISGKQLVLRLDMEDGQGNKSYSIIPFNGTNIRRNELVSRNATVNTQNYYSENIVKDENNFVNTPANSYIVSTPDIYQISTKKPSGVQINGGTYVTWLWASKENGGKLADIKTLINNISYNPDDKTIMFRVGAQAKGNVILALRDNSNNILWTWHIWITDTPQEKTVGANTFLDRNLGALSADIDNATGINTFGFVYQWGRKDPFYGGGNIFAESTALSFAESNTIFNNDVQWNGVNVNRWVKYSQVASVNDAIKYPMRFYSIPKAVELKDDMSNPVDWLSSGTNNFWSSAQKTDYDPCPHGYKVPTRSELTLLHNVDEDLIWFFKRSDFNYWQLYRDKETPVTAWPAAGMRLGRDIANKGAQLNYAGTSTQAGNCFYWTSTPVNLSGINPGGSHRIYTNGNTIYGEIEYGDNADAYPVRCVKYTP